MMEEDNLQETQAAAEEVGVSDGQPGKKKEHWRKTIVKDIRETLTLIAIFMVIYVLFFRAVVVEGSSMNSTLVDGDRLLIISTLIYQNPKQGDVIVAAKDGFRDGEPIVKRVIAVEGQTVDIDFERGIVYVDGVALDEPYISSPTLNSEGISFPVTVPEGCVFVMGDNRMNSKDSRSKEIGMVDEREILGKVILLIWPGSDDTYSFDISRIGLVR